MTAALASSSLMPGVFVLPAELSCAAARAADVNVVVCIGDDAMAVVAAAFAGGGIRKGVVHGATDELGFHAVEDRHYVTDLHATVLQLLGLEPRKLSLPGRKRLEIDYGKPITAIMS